MAPVWKIGELAQRTCLTVRFDPRAAVDDHVARLEAQIAHGQESLNRMWENEDPEKLSHGRVDAEVMAYYGKVQAAQ